jgi:hypothetical protein
METGGFSGDLRADGNVLFPRIFISPLIRPAKAPWITYISVAQSAERGIVWQNLLSLHNLSETARICLEGIELFPQYHQLPLEASLTVFTQMVNPVYGATFGQRR